MKEALFYEKLKGKKVRCYLCHQHCLIEEGKKGICGVRLNQGGVLYSLVYGKLISENLDPIEKKPLFHLLPGTYSYSIATVGCNFQCEHCQNWQISQYRRDEIPGSLRKPEEVVRRAIEWGAQSISYTYTEPTIFFEFALDTAKLASEKGIKNVFVTNGYMEKEVLEEISPFLDACNVDLKSFREDFYRKVCKARLTSVLENIKLMKKLGIWVEVTTLIIPGLNDSEEELKNIARFIKEVDESIPWHVTAFYPAYKMTHLPPTSLEVLIEARRLGLKEGLKYVYTGNVRWREGEDTYCPHCGRVVIARSGFSLREVNLKGNRCLFCGGEIDGIFEVPEGGN